MTIENEIPILSARPSSPWRWAALALVAVVLVYPVVRRLIWQAGAPAPALRAAIDSSSRAFNAGRYEEALAYGNVALRTDPASADAYNNIAAAWAGLRNWDSAIQNIQQAIRIKPSFQLARNNLAWYQRQKAAGVPRPKLPPPPSPVPPAASYLNVSRQLFQAGKYRECIHVAKEALKLDPNSDVAYNNIAAARSAMGMWDDAIAAAYQAVRIDPAFALARNNLAWAVEQKRRTR